MLELIVLSILMILVGCFMRYKNQKKPRVGIKRNSFGEYLQDYLNLKLYWSSFAFIFVGSAILLAMLIIELVM